VFSFAKCFAAEDDVVSAAYCTRRAFKWNLFFGSGAVREGENRMRLLTDRFRANVPQLLSASALRFRLKIIFDTIHGQDLLNVSLPPYKFDSHQRTTREFLLRTSTRVEYYKKKQRRTLVRF